MNCTTKAMGIIKKGVLYAVLLMCLAILTAFSVYAEGENAQAEVNTASLGTPVETWDISATASDNVVANLYNHPEKSGYYTLVISGTGSMKRWGAYSYSPWYSNYCQFIHEAIIMDGVSNIGEYAFRNCNLLTRVDIGNSVASIGEGAFENCYILNCVIIPDNVTYIGSAAFANTYKLSNVFIGSGVENINSAFNRCSGITNISVSENNTVYKSKDGNLYSKDGKILFKYAVGKTNSSFNIPDSVTSIAAYAFFGSTNLTNVNIPNSVISIEEYAFRSASNLVYVNIPDSVTSIGASAFNGCYNLVSVSIGNGVTYIGDRFEYCYSLMNINVASNNTAYKSIDGNLYSKDGKDLIRYSIGKTETSFIIPDSVTNIDSYAFANCIDLVNVTIGNNVTNIGYGAFEHCSNIIKIIIPDNVTNIEAYAFAYCEKLTIVTIGNGVTELGYSSFRDCSNLTSVTIGNSLTNIKDGTFSGSQKLIEVVNNSSIEITQGSGDNGNVGRYALEIHTGESKIVDKNDCLFYTYNGVNYLVGYIGTDFIVALPSDYNGQSYQIYKYAFYNNNNISSIIIPDGITNIFDTAFSGCSRLVEVVNNSSLIITNSYIYNGGGAGVYAIEIHAGESKIEEKDGYVFYTYKGVNYLVNYVGKDKALVLPASYKEQSYQINKYVFEGNNKLTSVTIPDSVISIGDYAFSNCGFLQKVIIGDNVTCVGALAFSYCTSLVSVSIGKGVEVIDKDAFRACYSLVTIDIGDSVKTIESGVFYDCDSLTYVTIGSGVKIIKTSAFGECSNIVSINVSESNTAYKSIDGSLYSKDGKTLIAYASGQKNTSVIIYDNISTILENVFHGCTSLKLVLIDSPEIAKALTTQSACGYLVNYAQTVAIRSDITEVGSYVTSNFTFVNTVTVLDEDGNKVDYKVYSKHSHDADAAIWVEDSSRGVYVCSSCGLEKYAGCSHANKYERSRVEPSCFVDGSSEWYCPDCETVVETVVLPKYNSHLDPLETITVPATCTVDGRVYTYCTRCKEEIETLSTIKAGHIYPLEERIKIEPTCTEEGVAYDYCTRCQSQVGEDRPKDPLGHMYPLEERIKIAPTCTEEGVAYDYCTRCQSQVGEDRPKDPLGHIYPLKEITEPATCTENGRVYTYCTRCNSEIETLRTIEATGHKYAEWTVTAKPTATTKGVASGKCQNDGCDDVCTQELPSFDSGLASGEYTSNSPKCTEKYIYVYIKLDLTIEGDVKGHSSKEVEEKPASCYENGHTAGTICSVCEVTLSGMQTIPRGHKFDDNSTVYTDPARCEREGREYIKCQRSGCEFTKTEKVLPALEHSYPKTWETVKSANCNSIGIQQRKCQNPDCNNYDRQNIAKTAHVPISGVCVNCGISVGEDGGVAEQNSVDIYLIEGSYDHFAKDGSSCTIYLNSKLSTAEEVKQLITISDAINFTAFTNFKVEKLYASQNAYALILPREYNRTYRVDIAKGVDFSHYNKRYLFVKFFGTDNKEGSLSDEVVMLKYDDTVFIGVDDIDEIKEKEYFYVRVDVNKQLNSGTTVCITNAATFDELIKSNDPDLINKTVFGEIFDITDERETYMLKLRHVDAFDIFSELNISGGAEFVLKQNADTIEDAYTDKCLDWIKNDKGFKNFIDAISETAKIYGKENDLDIQISEENAQPIFSIDFDITAEEVKDQYIFAATLTVITTIPYSSKDLKINGKIACTIKLEDTLYVTLRTYADKPFGKAVEYDFYAGVTNVMTVEYDFNVNDTDINDDVNHYIGDLDALVSHRASCRRLEYVTKTQTYDSKDQMAKNHSDNPQWSYCSLCKPQKDYEWEKEVDFKSMFKKTYEHSTWEAPVSKSTEVGTGGGALEMVKKAIAGVTGGSENGLKIDLGTLHTGTGGVFADANVYLYFEFDAQALINLEYTKTMDYGIGIRGVGFSFEAYRVAEKSEIFELDMVGKVRIDYGIGLDMEISYFRLIAVGADIRLGPYIEVSGIIDGFYATIGNEGLKFNVDRFDMYVETGISMKLTLSVRVLFIRLKLPSLGADFPIGAIGSQRIYYDYRTPTGALTLDVENSDPMSNERYLNIDEKGLSIMYFDLENLKDVKNTALSLAPNNDYNIQYSIDENDYCEVDGSYIKLKEGVNHNFSITVKVSITDKNSNDLYKYQLDTIDVNLNVTAHNWRYNESASVKATCIDKSKYVWKCTECGEVFEFVGEKSPNNHGEENIKEYEYEPSTCYSNGHEEYKQCTKCRKITSTKDGKIPYIQKSEHDFSGDFVVDKQATCVSEGSKSVHCANYDKCRAKGYVVTIPTDPDNHNIAVLKAAKAQTCTEDGWTSHEKCSRCTYEKLSVELVSYGHFWSEEYTVDKAPGAEVGGQKSLHCIREIDGKVCDAINEDSKIYLVGTSYTPVKYQLSSDGSYYYVTGFADGAEAETLKISHEYNWLPVRKISKSAFEGSDIKTLILPSSITYIGESAFRNCASLVTANIPDEVTAIGANAFEGCASLSSIAIPNKVTTVGDYAFCGCTSLKNVSLGSLETIGANAFSGCTSLGSITIPGTAISVGDAAFWGCTSLKNVSLGSLETIGANAFSGCTSLGSINIPVTVKSVGDAAFYGCTSLGSVSVQNGVTSIGSGAFYGCTSLGAISLPVSVTQLGDAAFYGCTSLKYAELGSVMSIETNLFNGCTSLGSIVIPNTAEIINPSAFNGCISLKSVSLGSVEGIYYNAFTGCTSLESIVIPDSVTHIYNEAFKDCTSLKSVTFGSGLVNMRIDVFSGCMGIKTVNAPSLDAWCGILFENASANPLHTGAELRIGGQLITSVTVPSGIEKLQFTFYGCKQITSVSFASPYSVKKIQYAFYGTGYYLDEANWENGLLYCGAYLLDANQDCVKKVSIREGTVLIADSCFASTNITDVHIPSGVKYIGSYAFESRYSLLSIHIGKDVEEIGDGAFDRCVNVTEATVAGENNYYYSDDNCIIKLDGRVLIAGFNDGQIPDNVLVIGDSAYSAKNIKYLVISSSVKEINASAFAYCDELIKVTLGRSVSAIKGSAFDSCMNIVEVVNLSELDIKKGDDGYGGVARNAIKVHSDPDYSAIKTVGSFMFCEGDDANYLIAYLGSSKDITLPESYKGGRYNVYKRALSDAEYTSIVINGGVCDIGERAFSECYKLTSVTLNGVERIGSGAFDSCPKLEKVVIPSTVTELGGDSFRYSEMIIAEGNTVYKKLGSAVIRIADGCVIRIEVGDIPRDPSITGIENGAFVTPRWYSKLIVIPSNIKTVEEGTFDVLYGENSLVIENPLLVEKLLDVCPKLRQKFVTVCLAFDGVNKHSDWYRYNYSFNDEIRFVDSLGNANVYKVYSVHSHASDADCWQNVSEDNVCAKGFEGKECKSCNIRTGSELAPDHDWAEWSTVSEPTCKEYGKRIHTCTKCNVTEEETVDRLPHTPGKVVVDTPPTDTEAGLGHYVCSVCGDRMHDVELPKESTYIDFKVGVKALEKGVTYAKLKELLLMYSQFNIIERLFIIEPYETLIAAVIDYNERAEALNTEHKTVINTAFTVMSSWEEGVAGIWYSMKEKLY